MNLFDINPTTKLDIWFIPLDRSEIIPDEIGILKYDAKISLYSLKFKSRIYKVKLRDLTVQENLNLHIKRGSSVLVQLKSRAPDSDGSVELQICFFNGDLVEMREIEIFISSHIQEKLRNLGIYNIDEAQKFLLDQVAIDVAGEQYFTLLAGFAADDDYERNNESNGTANLERHFRTISIQGITIKLPLAKEFLSKIGQDYYLKIDNIVFARENTKLNALKLARGKIKFIFDSTKMKAVSTMVSGNMLMLLRDPSSYLKTWDEYGRIEGKIFLDKAKKIGAIHFKEYEIIDNGRAVRFFLTNALSEDLELNDSLDLAIEKPIFITNPDITWDEYLQYLDEQERQKKKATKSYGPYQIKNIKNTYIDIACDEHTIDPNAFLIWSVMGDETQIKRRMKARESVLMGEAANGELGQIIEYNGIISRKEYVKEIVPLSYYVNQKIFSHPPTPKQQEAISIGLNTPDIALIQGPPGTGKTTVITAIIERLNELYDKSNSIRGQILVSGFQHDAVENIISRLSINSLPSVKFGTKSVLRNELNTSTMESLHKWCDDLADKIRAKNPEIKNSEEIKKLTEIQSAYILSPSKNNAKSLLKQMIELPRNLIESIHVESILALQLELESEDKLDVPEDIITAIHGLRSEEKAFLDDGVTNAMKLMILLEGNIGSKEKKLLEKVTRWQLPEPLDFLHDIKQLQRALLNKFKPRPELNIDKINEEILAISRDVIFALRDGDSIENQRDSIVANFLAELENNPFGVREAIEDYNFVYGATTQQAAGRELRMTKHKYLPLEEAFKTNIEFDTVIIDEAARTSPRDLLIPMTMAKKRIILVGDHRQLPHIIEKKVLEELETELKDGNFEYNQLINPKDCIEQSMFKYLFERLKHLELQDGIKRTVTLDSQYRTHPVLGQFASDMFYKEYDEDYNSPLSETFFRHSLKGIENKPAVWIDVPAYLGYSIKNENGSTLRTIEAEEIAIKLNEWIKSPDSKKLSFGIITFYKAQTDEIFRALAKYKITYQDDEGRWQIADEYLYIQGSTEEKLRIGTVDAFQGMEFDIVFLSLVRTADAKRFLDDKNQVKQGIEQKDVSGVFGYILSPNRLCVSMTRQKKCLITFGDSAFMASPLAKKFIPAIYEFYQLCKQKGVVFDYKK